MKHKSLIILSSLALFIFSCGGEEGPANLPPPQIQVYETTTTEVPIYREFVGETLGFKDIDIRARVEGYLEGIHFEEGSVVEEGKLLYTIESQPFEEKVAEKMSALAATRINLANAESDLGRIRPLAEQNAISQIDLDSAQARYEASIESVKAAEANLRAAEIQLSYTKIHSPITGIIGKTQAKVGDFVGASPNPVNLNTVSDINTMLVQFFLTETEYLQAARRIIAETDLAHEGEAREEGQDLQLILADNSVYKYKGKFDFVDRNVDPATGAILIQASFSNPDQLLRPGLFARVRAKVKVVENAILVPQRCVIELQGKFSVLVVDENDIVQNRQVQIGPKIKGFWLINEGLNPGERVIYEGLQKVKEGQKVNPKPVDIKIPDLTSI
ncbi:efflux RND transporter periplasmic adaptor subunit [Desulfobacterota bacterium AH_259_B03_O07]|nr:efflux RND transporter periplasmic adaptor subunit [Desulfobacterota bacterium AH_259_B03_O07]